MPFLSLSMDVGRHFSKAKIEKIPNCKVLPVKKLVLNALSPTATPVHVLLSETTGLLDLVIVVSKAMMSTSLQRREDENPR